MVERQDDRRPTRPTAGERAWFNRLTRERDVLRSCLHQLQANSETAVTRAPEVFDRVLSPGRFIVRVAHETRRILQVADRIEMRGGKDPTDTAMSIEEGRRLEMEVRLLKWTAKRVFDFAEPYLPPFKDADELAVQTLAEWIHSTLTDGLSRADRVLVEGESALPSLLEHERYIPPELPHGSLWARIFGVIKALRRAG